MSLRDKARNFVVDWTGRGDEESHSQSFWLDLIREVFGVEKSSRFIQFEKSVSFEGHTHKIDAYIPSTKVLIEQKSFGNDLNKKYLQSDKTFLTPLEQAFRYAENMTYFERPRWIVLCNFSEFRIYYTQKFFFYYEIGEPVIVKLENLPDEYDRLKFLVDPDDTTILDDVNFSKTALSIIDKVRNDFRQRYIEKPVDGWNDFLYKICVRLVFCFFADDLHLFNEETVEEKFFADYLKRFSGNAQIKALSNIFDVLSTPYNLRGNFDEELQKFPYVNGKLFEEKLIFPDYGGYHTTPLAASLMPRKADENFHWEKISPPVFGAMFEDALNPSARRKGGMHYTSVENIHKVIDPLFLDDLRAEFKSVKGARKNKLDKLKAFQNKLASLTFLDPACGSGNFLTETFISIRGLENEAIREMYGIDKNLFDENPVKVQIENFFGIEIHAYAVAVAQVAMWIANLQMLRKTENILSRKLNPLPLKNIPQIICANALTIDWENVVPKDKLNFIIGNPPFVGRRQRDERQAAEVAKFFSYKDVDYVACWYKKAADYIKGTKIEVTFVSTNSITQGEQVTAIWKNLPVTINFAYRTFKWTSESSDMAAVHCVIISFSMKARRKKFIYDGDKVIPAKNINPYLIDAENVYIEHRIKPICDVPEMCMGNMELGNGNLIINDDDYDEFIANEPVAKKFIKKLIGAEEFINGKKRYCLWLVDCPPDELKKMPLVMKRVNACRLFRMNGSNDRKKFVDTPHLFRDRRNPEKFIVVPRVSSENRYYVPIDFLTSDTIVTDRVQIIPDAQIYHFGILTSSVHMAWMRAVCGRLKSDYNYSKNIVYNNFVWCNPSCAQKKLIEQTAQKILDVRADFSGKTFAYLYDEKTMPPELRAAHKDNDVAVKAAYGFDEEMTESEIVAALMNLYKNFNR